jgi:hypothetical protein
MALFCRLCFDLFQLVSAYSLSQNTIDLAEISRLFHQPNQPNLSRLAHQDQDMLLHVDLGLV